MLIVALAGASIALVKTGHESWTYRTYEKIHDEALDLWFGPGNFTAAFPDGERQRLISERSARAKVAK
jgi:hypothetical protein